MLRTLRNHGTPEASLKDIFRATVMAKILYCAPAWSGFCSAADRAKVDAFLRRCKRSGYCELSMPTMAELFTDADDAYFLRILSNKNHVLQTFLPGWKTSTGLLVESQNS